RAVATAAAENEKSRAELQNDRQQVAARGKELEDRKSKVQDAFNEELAEIGKQDRPLVQDLTRLTSRGTVLNNNLLAYESDIARLQKLGAAEKDPARRQQYLFDADRLSLIAARVEADILANN